MATLTFDQVAAYAYGAGFRGTALTTAVAVAMAESSNRTDVVNAIQCVGLWQINSRVHKRQTIEQLKDPKINAREAFIISSGGLNWTPWEAYTRGMHTRYMGSAQTAAQKVATAGGGATAGIPGVPLPPNPVDLGTDIGETIKTAKAAREAFETLSKPETWIRIGVVVFALVLIILALMRMSQTDEKLELAQTVLSVVPTPVTQAVSSGIGAAKSGNVAAGAAKIRKAVQ